MAETSPAPAIPSLAPEVYQEPSKRTKHSTPALAGILLAAGSALLFHLRQDRKRQAATSQAITELRAERDLAQKQLQKVELRLSKHLEDFDHINGSNREIMDAYESILKNSEELAVRLDRTELYNRELQHKIKRERSERARCEKKIIQLQKKIEEQEALLKLQKTNENGSPHSARSDDSASVLEENNKKVSGIAQQKWTKQLH